MQDETKSVPRLDRSKPPPGWGDPFEIEHLGCWHVTDDQANYTTVTNCADNRATALAKAWNLHETEHDPPGMVGRWEPGDRCHDALDVGEWHVEVDIGGPALLVWHEHYDSQGDINRDGAWMSPAEWVRRVAWKWYWRRARLAEAAASHVGSVYGPESESMTAAGLWPAMLTWPDDHVAAIEALLRGEVAIAS